MNIQYVYYFLIITFFVSNISYRKITNSLRKQLKTDEQTSIETWDIVKEQAFLGNKLAILAFCCFSMELLSAISLFGLFTFFLTN